MPISIIGPMKMRKFARKRNTTNTIWIQNAPLWKRWPIFVRKVVALPHQVTVSPGAEVRTWYRNATVMMLARKIAKRKNERHVHERRRLTMSSSRRRASSVPNRLGHGIIRRMTRSTTPRNAITKPNVRSSDLRALYPTWWWNQKYVPGLVSSATIVAIRLSLRS